jgi:hypothetical protein
VRVAQRAKSIRGLRSAPPPTDDEGLALPGTPIHHGLTAAIRALIDVGHSDAGSIHQQLLRPFAAFPTRRL